MPEGSGREGARADREEVTIGPMGLDGRLALPELGRGIVLFAHGSGSGRLSPRNVFVADELERAGFGTLLFDLLTEPEATDRRNVFDIGLLADRLLLATGWLAERTTTRDLPVAYFGASTGAAAALVDETRSARPIRAVVSRGGRPDLAGDALRRVRAPTLLVVGGQDHGVVELNERAFLALPGERRLEVVPGAGHLFEEPGTLERVVALARDWFAPRLRTGA
jgi:putative phosphoribosyl transferase